MPLANPKAMSPIMTFGAPLATTFGGPAPRSMSPMRTAIWPLMSTVMLPMRHASSPCGGAGKGAGGLGLAVNLHHAAALHVQDGLGVDLALPLRGQEGELLALQDQLVVGVDLAFAVGRGQGEALVAAEAEGVLRVAVDVLLRA